LETVVSDTNTAAKPGPASAGTPADPPLNPQRWRILVILAAVAFMAQLDVFIVNIAVPAIRASYPGTSLSGVSWVLNAYTVVFAALLVPFGRLADHFGRRRFLLAGVLIFTVGSALCAVSPDLGLLIVGRGIQAIGAALIVPTSLGLLYPAFPRSQHALVVGIWAAVQSVAATAGPPIGGLLIGLSWRWIFVINLPIGIATLLAGRRILPEVRANHGARLPDGVSAVLLLAAVSLLVVATVQGPGWGWGAISTIVLFVLAALATAATVARTLLHPHALIEKTLFSSRPFTISSIAIFLVFVSFASWLLITVLFFENEWHYSALRAGLAIAPGPGATAIFAVNARRLARRLGSAFPAVAGTFVLGGAGIWWYALAGSRPDYVLILPALLLTGVASGLTQTPLLAAVNTLPADRATTGSAVLNMSRQIGSAVGVALLVALLATSSPHELGEFQRGWLLVALSGWGAMAAVLVGLARDRANKHAADQQAGDGQAR
jgi:EmrB/QacA subfamily drug resistance transporter